MNYVRHLSYTDFSAENLLIRGLSFIRPLQRHVGYLIIRFCMDWGTIYLVQASGLGGELLPPSLMLNCTLKRSSISVPPHPEAPFSTEWLGRQPTIHKLLSCKTDVQLLLFATSQLPPQSSQGWHKNPEQKKIAAWITTFSEHKCHFLHYNVKDSIFLLLLRKVFSEFCGEDGNF